MHAQLMTAAGDGREPHARALRGAVSRNDIKVSCRRLADDVINYLSRAVGPVANQRQINRTCVVLDQPVRNRDIVFADRALLERTTDSALRINAARKHHQSGGFHIKAMHNQRVRKLGLDSCAQTVLLVWPATGDGKQPGGFFDDDEMLVNGDDLDALWKRFHCDWCHTTDGESRGGTAPTKSITISLRRRLNTQAALSAHAADSQPRPTPRSAARRSHPLSLLRRDARAGSA